MEPSAVAAEEPNDHAKSRKACINCRRQKMKCRIEDGSSCRRCLRSGMRCVFVPRANAASNRGFSALSIAVDDIGGIAAFKDSVLARLQRLENHVGILDGEDLSSATTVGLVVQSPLEDGSSALWNAANVLRQTCSIGTEPAIWEYETIKRLWASFHDCMPGLHFLSSKQTFSSPTPLLLSAMLFCSSIRGQVDVAALSTSYRTVLCNAIAQLCVPGSKVGQPSGDSTVVEEWAFQTVLGIILAGLLSEAFTKETGIWLSIAYRLVLDHAPAPNVDTRSREWRELFSGLQIVDMEHASLYLSYPIVPIEAPLARLQLPMQDQLYKLSRMMHTGLTYFTGRGLPTIWSCFSSGENQNQDVQLAFSAIDAAVIRDWAQQLDNWLVEFSNKTFDSENKKRLVFRQYILHRLLVLSIYHPARGCNLFSNAITPREQHELIVSARAAVKLHLGDTSIWANWDLVMITWAALIILQAIEGGIGEEGDMEIVRVHLDRLKETRAPRPSLGDILAGQLQSKIDSVLESSVRGENDAEVRVEAVVDDASWYIFNQASLDTGYQFWSYDG